MKRPVTIIVAMNFVVAMSLHVFFSQNFFDFSKHIFDFPSMLIGAHIAADNRLSELYDLNVQKEYYDRIVFPATYDNLLPFRMVPLSAYMLSVLASVVPLYSLIYLIALNIILLAVVFMLFHTHAGFKSGIFLMQLVLPYFAPIWANIYNAQFSIIILLLLSLVYYFYKKGKYVLAGTFLAFLSLKVNFLLFVPLFLAMNFYNKKSLEILKGFLPSSVILLAVNMYLYGWNFVVDYLQFLRVSESVMYGTDGNLNFNLNAVLGRLMFSDVFPPAFHINFCMSVAVYLGCVFYLAKRTRGLYDKYYTDVFFSLCVMLTVFLNVHTMPVDLVVLVLPMLIWAIRYRKYLVFFVLFMIPIAGYWRSIVPFTLLPALAVCLYALHPQLFQLKDRAKMKAV